LQHENTQRENDVAIPATTQELLLQQEENACCNNNKKPLQQPIENITFQQRR
jgi:hypothetical protein